MAFGDVDEDRGVQADEAGGRDLGAGQTQQGEGAAVVLGTGHDGDVEGPDLQAEPLPRVKGVRHGLAGQFVDHWGHVMSPLDDGVRFDDRVRGQAWDVHDDASRGMPTGVSRWSGAGGGA